MIVFGSPLTADRDEWGCMLAPPQSTSRQRGLGGAKAAHDHRLPPECFKKDHCVVAPRLVCTFLISVHSRDAGPSACVSPAGHRQGRSGPCDPHKQQWAPSCQHLLCQRRLLCSKCPLRSGLHEEPLRTRSCMLPCSWHTWHLLCR